MEYRGYPIPQMSAQQRAVGTVFGWKHFTCARAHGFVMCRLSTAAEDSYKEK